MLKTESVASPTCPEQLTAGEIDAYRQQGFLAFENVLTAEEVVAARESLSRIVRDNAFAPGRCDMRRKGADARGNQSGIDFQLRDSRCFFQLEPGQEPAADPEALEGQVRKFMWFEDQAEIFRSCVSTHPRVFGIVAQLFGGEPVLYQSMALVKPPHYGSEKPWHQDNAYFAVEDMEKVAGVWIALDDVDVSNGCMHVIPGGHRAGPLRHHHTFDCEIIPGRIDVTAARPVPLRAGGAMFFHANLPHQTPPNRSDKRRRALQFHFRRADNPVISHERFDEIFAEADGTPASCDAARRNGF